MPLDTRSLTVVIPTYNRQDCLELTLRALLACRRDGRSVAVHVIDDASQEAAREVVERVARECPREVRMSYHPQDRRGSGAARNRGIGLAETDLVLFLDDDCVPEPGWLLAMAEGPWDERTGGLGGKVRSAEAGGTISRYFRYLRYDENGIGKDGPLPVGATVEYCGAGNAAFRRDVLEEVGGFEPILGGGGVDMDLGWRVGARGYVIRFQPEAVIHHHHKETLRGLLRTFWTQGYRGTLRRMLWGTRKPCWGKLTWEAARYPLHLLRAVLLPVDAVLLTARGVPARDAAVFAGLEWLRKGIHRAGGIAMTWRILTGRQRLDRTADRPGLKSGAVRAKSASAD